jgi:hypothetical protein
MSNPFSELTESVPTKGSGEYMSQLTDEGREVLDTFEAWLVQVDKKAASTAQAYKGYVAQAYIRTLAGEGWDDFSTDIRSALHALKRFEAATNEVSLEAAADEQ